MEQKRVLVIYEIVPEETKKTVVMLDDSDYQQLKAADGYIINACEYNEEANEAALHFDWAFYSGKEDYKHECKTELARKLYATMKNMSSLELAAELQNGVDAVICTGFYL